MSEIKYILTLPLLFLAPSALAHPAPDVIESIYWSDGDSGWINGRTTGYAFRLADIDAPETGRAKCEAERKMGYEAKAFAVETTRNAKLSITAEHGHDRYERHVIVLSVNGEDLRAMGVELGHYGWWRHKNGRAVEARPVWCEEIK